MAFNDHFSALARAYADYRPTYPPELGAFLAEIAPGRQQVWDCATGQGQAAGLMAGAFERVWATDASERQLSEARAIERVQFAVATEAASGLPDQSCDLVTVAQAAHWFDLPAFYAEARRVLRPRGVIAVWGYSAVETDDVLVNDVVHEFQFGRVAPYWPPGRELVDDRYASLPFPFPRLPNPAFEMTALWTREQLLGYISSWSAVDRCRREEGVDPMAELLEELEPLWPVASEARDVRWPLFLLAGRV